MFRKTHKRWWPGCDVYYSYLGGSIPQDKFYKLNLQKGISYIKKYYPKTVTIFSLDRSEFRYGIEGVTEIVNAIPAHITSLSINAYGMHNYHDKDLKNLLAALSKQVTSIHLNYFDYDNEREDYQFEHLKNTKPGAELAHIVAILGELNHPVTEVHIACKLKLDEWIQVLQALPATVTYADISPIYTLGADGIKQALQHLPPTVATLEISRNNLNEMGADQIVQLLQNMPETVTTLDLKLNQLHLLGKKGVSRVIAAIPPHLHVKFDYNDIEKFELAGVEEVMRVSTQMRL